MDNDNELFRRFARIKGHPNYAVNPMGVVININTGRVLKKEYTHDGYERVKLDHVTCYIHKLVAETFIPNPENKKYVNHKNGRVNDNFVMNLIWTNQRFPHKFSHRFHTI